MTKAAQICMNISIKEYYEVHPAWTNPFTSGSQMHFSNPLQPIVSDGERGFEDYLYSWTETKETSQKGNFQRNTYFVLCVYVSVCV